MTTQANAAHVLAEIRSLHRRVGELSALDDGRLQQDPAITPEGEPNDSSWELDSAGKLTQAVHELVQNVTAKTVINFRDIPDVRVRLIRQGPQVQEAHLETQIQNHWISTPLEQDDLQDIQWLLQHSSS